MLLADHFHSSYCTNIHPGEDWDTTFKALRDHVPKVKAHVCPSAPFGLGLRLSDQASRELGEGERLDTFRDWLNEENLYVYTMNGFPYGAFHGTRVKDRVHEPDWTTTERLAYTRRLFRQLAKLLPAGMEGGISTSPVSYRHWHKTPDALEHALRTGARQMAEVGAFLWKMEQEEEVEMHLDIEPEPDGLLENAADVIRFYRDYLIPEGVPVLMRQCGLSEPASRTALLRHIALCYDICHFALAFESPDQTFPLFEKEGIRIGKVQVSAALKILPGSGERTDILEALRAFEEPVYLHQVTRLEDAGVKTFPDLPDFLEAPGDFTEARAHFHVPIFTDRFGLLRATQSEILEVLGVLKNNRPTRHLEVETYTWEVLPAGLKQDLVTSISRELQWLNTEMDR